MAGVYLTKFCIIFVLVINSNSIDNTQDSIIKTRLALISVFLQFKFFNFNLPIIDIINVDTTFYLSFLYVTHNAIYLVSFDLSQGPDL